MGAARDLGHDPTEAGVLVDARRDRVGEQVIAPHQTDAGLVARGLDPEDQGFVSHRSIPLVDVSLHDDRVDVAAVVARATVDLAEAVGLVQGDRGGVVGGDLEKDPRTPPGGRFDDHPLHQVAADPQPASTGQHRHPLEVGDVVDVAAYCVADRLGAALVGDLGQPHLPGLAQRGELLLDRSWRPGARGEDLELEHHDRVEVVGGGDADVSHRQSTRLGRPGRAASGRRR